MPLAGRLFFSAMDYDKTEMAKTYRKGRSLDPEVLQQWMDVVAANVERRNAQTILDLGCGTGRFSEALAEQFDANVVGVDPSRTMLDEAQSHRTHSRVFYARGSAEFIPLKTNSVDVVFMSMAFHHFTDPPAVAEECRRVLRPEGRVCLRTGSREKIPAYPYVPYFPGTVTLIEQRLPSIGSQREVFEAASFKVLFEGEVWQEIAPDFPTYAEKIALRADSILVSLEDREFDAGVAMLRAEKTPGPIVEPIDFLVFGKR
jgi:ubiquinone/menaquinone biosynthesis C-methylase UbiE